MNKAIGRTGLGAPSANYELAMVSTGDTGRPTRQLHTSGIGPVRADGTVPGTVAEQADVVWSTLLALLGEADMALSDVVQVTTFVVDPSSGVRSPDDTDLAGRLAAAMAARDGALGSHRCASVLVPVPALASTSWLIEVALVAIAEG